MSLDQIFELRAPGAGLLLPTCPPPPVLCYGHPHSPCRSRGASVIHGISYIVGILYSRHFMCGGLWMKSLMAALVLVAMSFLGSAAYGQTQAEIAEYNRQVAAYNQWVAEVQALQRQIDEIDARAAIRQVQESERQAQQDRWNQQEQNRLLEENNRLLREQQERQQRHTPSTLHQRY